MLMVRQTPHLPIPIRLHHPHPRHHVRLTLLQLQNHLPQEALVPALSRRDQVRSVLSHEQINRQAAQAIDSPTTRLPAHVIFHQLVRVCRPGDRIAGSGHARDFVDDLVAETFAAEVVGECVQTDQVEESRWWTLLFPGLGLRVGGRCKGQAGEVGRVVAELRLVLVPPTDLRRRSTG